MVNKLPVNPNKDLKVCVSSICFSRLFIAKELDVAGFLLKCGKLKVDAVELCDLTIRSRRRDYLSSLDRLLKKNVIRLQAVAIRNDFSSPNHAANLKSVEHVSRWIKVASFLSAPVVRIWSGDNSAEDKAFYRIKSCVKKIMPLAEKLKIMVAMENHGGMSLNPDNLVRLVAQIRSPYFGSCPDFGNFRPGDRYSGFSKLLKCAFHIHAKSHEFNKAGTEKTIDYQALITTIKKSSYENYLSIEYEGNHNELRGTQQTIDLIKRYWS